KGSSNGITWTAFKNISDATGTVNFQASGSVSGNVTADTLNYSTYTSDLTLDVTAGTITGVGGNVVANTIKANAGQNNTVGGTGATYPPRPASADKGTSSGYTWTAFQNVNDATGTVVFGNASSVSGNVTAATLNETGYGSNLAVTI